MTTLHIGNYQITQEDGKLIIDISNAPKGSTFQILALLSQYAQEPPQKKRGPKPRPADASGKKPAKTSKAPKQKRIHRLSVDHPVILEALEMKAKGARTKDILSKLNISTASYYRWTREAQKQSADKAQ